MIKFKKVKLRKEKYKNFSKSSFLENIKTILKEASGNDNFYNDFINLIKIKKMAYN